MFKIVFILIITNMFIMFVVQASSNSKAVTKHSISPNYTLYTNTEFDEDDIQYRIHHGQQVKEVKYEFFCTLNSKILSKVYFTQFCGCSLIGNQAVLTAAHCILNDKTPKYKPEDLEVQFLRLTTSNSFTKSKAIYARIDFYILHHKYIDKNDRKDYGYDVAILFLDRAIPNIKPISIGLPRDSFIGNKVTIIGHGLTERNKSSAELLEAQITISECMRTKYMDKGQICANNQTDPKAVKDTCSGDSGGALFTSKSIRIVGVNSQGTGCALYEYPGVYVNITSSELLHQLKFQVLDLSIGVDYDKMKYPQYIKLSNRELHDKCISVLSNYSGVHKNKQLETCKLHYLMYTTNRRYGKLSSTYTIIAILCLCLTGIWILFMFRIYVHLISRSSKQKKLDLLIAQKTLTNTSANARRRPISKKISKIQTTKAEKNRNGAKVKRRANNNFDNNLPSDFSYKNLQSYSSEYYILQ